MKRVSTKPQLPKLERLLIDADVRPTVMPYLKAVGFDAVSVLRVKVNHRDDVAIVKYARHYNRIVVCHDRHKDQVRYQMYQEIFKRGGRIIEIGGHNGKPELTSVGKILVHREDLTFPRKTAAPCLRVLDI